MNSNKTYEDYENHTTLCYIENDNKYLMLHRIKKEIDLNKDKWVGIGGHFLEGETVCECLLREAKEETGLDLISYKSRGFITFISDQWGLEYMHLFTADGFEGELTECDEGELVWVEKSKVYDLPAWEGDQIFLKLLEENREYFELTLEYKGEKLVRAELDGKIFTLC